MFREFVQSFAGETDISGLSLLGVRRSKLEVAFWCTFVLVFSCYTTKTLVAVTSRFLGEEVVTSVQEEIVADFVFPNPKLCFHGTPVNHGGSGDLSMQTVLEQYGTENDLNASAFFSALGFMTKLREIDKIVAKIDNRQNSTYSEFPIKTDMEAFLAHPPINLANFMNFLFEKFCRTMQFEITFFNSSTKSTNKDVANCDHNHLDFKWIDNISVLCVSLNASSFFFRDPDDNLTISFANNSSRELLGLDVTAQFDMNVDQDVTNFDSMFEMVVRKRRVHYVRLSAVYQRLDLRRQRCDPDRKRSVSCEYLCESNFLFQAYGCWPPISSDNLPQCDAIDYLNFTFAPTAAMIKTRKKCLKACFPPCTRPVFSITVADTMVSTTTVSTILVRSHVYPLFQERLANDWESFLSDFGGSLGLWLGASFASLVHIPVFLVVWLIKWRSNSQKEKEPTALVETETQTTITRDSNDDGFSLLEARVAALEESLLSRS